MAYDPDDMSDDDLAPDDSDIDEADGTVEMVPAFLFDCPECGEE